jgi:hypothetical protein
MRTVELLEEALAIAEYLGYHVRHEWLGGSGGGACEFGGRRWMFVDLALSLDEQLEQVTRSLSADPGVHQVPVSTRLSPLVGRRAA